jgi:hypothetical protein
VNDEILYTKIIHIIRFDHSNRIIKRGVNITTSAKLFIINKNGKRGVGQ